MEGKVVTVAETVDDEKYAVDLDHALAVAGKYLLLRIFKFILNDDPFLNYKPKPLYSAICTMDVLKDN